MLSEIDFMTIEQLKNKGVWPLSYIAGKSLPSILKEHFGGKFITGAEVGVCRGETSFTLLEQCKNIRMLYAIDAWKSYTDWIGVIDQPTLDKFLNITESNLKEYEKRVTIMKMDSVEASSTFGDHTLSFVFIDGDHSYEGVLKDLNAYYSKVKDGGIVSGHDWNMSSVSSAINDFVKQNSLSVEIKYGENNLWYWVKNG